MKKICFLGYDEYQTILIESLKRKNCNVKKIKYKVNFKEVQNSDLLILFGYRYILSRNFIRKCKCPIINLHISYLPFNRGAHPNFWSFYDDTQSGVSIHLVDYALDTGDILFQKKVHLNNNKTFNETYEKLKKELERLFIKNIEKILSNNWKTKIQKKNFTYHRKKDLPRSFGGWDCKISNEINKLKKIKIKFDKIKPNNSQIEELYFLLNYRRFSISHQKMPSKNNHYKFVHNNPYYVWYLLYRENYLIGSFYIQYDNSIGINLRKPDKKIILEIIRYIKQKYKPFLEIKSKIRKSYFLNVPSRDLEMIKILNKMKIQEIQKSFEI